METRLLGSRILPDKGDGMTSRFQATLKQSLHRAAIATVSLPAERAKLARGREAIAEEATPDSLP
jgi:hypothetical protein